MTINLTRIYTRLGDSGETSLGDLSRVPKDHPLVEACGAVDELNAVLGVILSQPELPEPFEQWIRRVQNDLLDLGADLSVPLSDGRERLRIGKVYTEWIEERCDEANNNLAPLHSFIIPGGNAAAALLHVARTVCRRAERRVLEAENFNPEILRYLNRLSDLLFILARATNESPEPLWVPGSQP